jgi:hypothetical protein
MGLTIIPESESKENLCFVHCLGSDQASKSQIKMFITGLVGFSHWVFPMGKTHGFFPWVL